MRGELIDYVMNEYEMNRKDAVQLILNYMECGELNELILDAEREDVYVELQPILSTTNE